MQPSNWLAQKIVLSASYLFVLALAPGLRAQNIKTFSNQCPKTISDLQKVFLLVQKNFSPDKLDEYIDFVSRCNNSVPKGIAENRCWNNAFNVAVINNRIRAFEKIQVDSRVLPDVLKSAEFQKIWIYGNLQELVGFLKKNLPSSANVILFPRESYLEDAKDDYHIVLRLNISEDEKIHFILRAGSDEMSVIRAKRQNGRWSNMFFDYTVNSGPIYKKESLPYSPNLIARRSCLNCHIQGAILPIITANPKDRKDILHLQASVENIKSIKNTINTDMIDFVNGINVNDLKFQTPPLGKIPLGSKFIKQCSKSLFGDDINLSEASLARIRNASKCFECHDGKKQAVINYPFDHLTMAHFMKNGYMPPKVSISPIEREVLAVCLIKNYYRGLGDGASEQGELFKFFFSPDCFAANGNGEKNKPH